MKIQCPDCKGTGLISFVCNEEEKEDCGFIPVYDFVVCLNCQGDGYFEVYEYEAPN